MTSASTPEPVVIALGSNVGPRDYLIRKAVSELSPFVRIVRSSRVIRTAPVDAPSGSPEFLNMVVAGYTHLGPAELLAALHGIEARLGRVRRVLNGPRTIDLDLILYSARMIRSKALTVPHPRYRQRSFVIDPLRELHLGWRDPISGQRL